MPYPPLSDALKNQSVFELHNVTGTFVGFFSPQVLGVPGWHFHFLTADNTHGGHVLEVTLQRARIQIDDTMTTLSVELPHTATAPVTYPVVTSVAVNGISFIFLPPQN